MERGRTDEQLWDLSPASLFSRDWSSSDTLRNTSSSVVSISPKLLRCSVPRLCSRCCDRAVCDPLRLGPHRDTACPRQPLF